MLFIKYIYENYFKKAERTGLSLSLIHIFTMHERAQINPAVIPLMLKHYGDQLAFRPDAAPWFLYRPRKKKVKEVLPVLEKTREFLETMRDLEKDLPHQE